MVLWVDKYRPTTLPTLELHADVTNRLQQMISSGDFPHILMWGPSGAGKKTRVNAMLKALYGPAAGKVKVQQKQFKIKTKVIDVSTLTSNYHIEMNPSDVGNNDRFVVQEVIKEIAQTHSVSMTSNAAKGGDETSTQQAAKQFKVVVLTEVDRLTKAAQNALRRTMEKYTVTEITNVLQKIQAKEDLSLPTETLELIAQYSDRNLRRAILMLEAYRVKNLTNTKSNKPSDDDIKSLRPDWETFIDNIGRSICEEQSPTRLLEVRNKLYELLINCIPPEIIMQKLCDVLLKRLDDSFKHEVSTAAAFYDHRMAQGSKPIFHLEAFVAKFMAIYKRWVLEAFG